MTLKEAREKMLTKAATSCLDAKDVKLLQFEPFIEGHELDVHPQWAGFKIPYFTLAGKVDPAFYRFRFLQTKPSKGFASIADEPKKPRRYSQPAGTQCGVYLPPLLSISWAEVAKDPNISIVITEGELKAACGCKFAIPTLGLGGVYNWRSAKESQELLPILEKFVWMKRKVTICFDSDTQTNPMVRMAASRLAYVLSMRGAEVTWAQLPPADDGSKQGMDDLVYNKGVKELAAIMIESAEDLGPGKELHRLNGEVALIRASAEIVELHSGNAYSASTFAESRYKNRHYMETDDNNRMIRKFAAKEWIAWPQRTEVVRLEYAPSSNNIITEDGAFNTWYPQRWPLVPSKKGTIQPWEELFGFLMEGLSAENKLWVRRWLACPIQVPGTKLLTALLIWGRMQGTGKTMLGETMKYIYGKNYGTVNNMQLQGSFNEWAKDKQFIVGDEISIGDRRGVANTLKDLITRNELRMNIKNRQTYVVQDCANYYFTSNHEDAIYLENTDRRIFVHEVATTQTLSSATYRNYHQWLTKDGGAERLFHYLKYELDLGDFDAKGKAPMTAAKAEMAASGRGDTEDWCVALAASPDVVLGEKHPYDLYTVEDLLKIYDPDDKQRTRSVGLGRSLNAAGVAKVASGSNNIVIEGARRRLYAVRNVAKYARMGPTEARKAYEAERPARFIPPSAGIASSGKFMQKGAGGGGGGGGSKPN